MVLAGSALPALADSAAVCAYRPALLASVDMLLAEPVEKPNFWRDQHGDDAAYLAIHHRGMDATAAEEFLTALEARTPPPQRIRELALAHASTSERLARIADLAQEKAAGSILPDLGRSVLRALVEHDGGDWLIGEMARWQAADAEAFGRSGIAHQVALLVAGLDDTVKEVLAAKAEQAGMWQLAMTVTAMREDLSALLDRIARLPREHWLAEEETEHRRRAIATSLGLAGLNPRFDIETQPYEVRQVDAGREAGAAMRAIVRLAALHPDAVLLMTAMNLTGEMVIGTVVAETVLGMVERGEVDPVADPDSITVRIITGIDVTLGRARRERMLGGFHLVSPSGSQGDRADHHVDRILARAALAPLLRGEAAGAPGRPPALTAGHDWDRALAVAMALSRGDAPAEDDQLIAADLLAGAGRFDEALVLLAGAADWRSARTRTHELMLDVDRRCGHLLAPVLPMMEHIYRFDAG